MSTTTRSHRKITRVNFDCPRCGARPSITKHFDGQDVFSCPGPECGWSWYVRDADDLHHYGIDPYDDGRIRTSADAVRRIQQTQAAAASDLVVQMNPVRAALIDYLCEKAEEIAYVQVLATDRHCAEVLSARLGRNVAPTEVGRQKKKLELLGYIRARPFGPWVTNNSIKRYVAALERGHKRPVVIEIQKLPRRKP